MFSWIRRKKWLILNVVMIGILASTLSIQVADRSDTVPRSVSIGIGNEKIIRLGFASDVAFAAGSLDYTYDGVADNVQFQAALDALPATGGRLVDVSAVQKNFVAMVTRAIDNVIIEGAGLGSYFVNDGGTALFTAGGNNWRFLDLRTDAGGITMGATTGWQWINIDDGSGVVYDFRTPSGSVVNGAFTGTFGSSVSASANVTRAETYVGAASGSPTIWKGQADFVCDGTADETELNTYLALGNVHLAPGTYYTADTIEVPSNTSFTGAGIDKTIILGAGAGVLYKNVANSDQVGGNTNIYISDMTIDGNWTAPTATGQGGALDLIKVTYSLVERVHCTRGYSHSCEVGRSQNVTLRDCRFSYPIGDDCLSIHDGNNVSETRYIYVERCEADHSTSATSDGFELDDGPEWIYFKDCYSHDHTFNGFFVHSHPGEQLTKHIFFDHCIADTCNTGFVADSSAAIGAIEDINFTNCHATNMDNVGILLQGIVKGSIKDCFSTKAIIVRRNATTGYKSSQINVSRNIVECSGISSAALGMQTQDSDDITISENIIVGNGLYFGCHVRSLNVDIANIRVLDNIFKNGSDGIYVQHAAGRTINGLTIIGNRCYDDQGTETQNGGIFWDLNATGTITNLTIKNNDFRDNKNRGVYMPATASALTSVITDLMPMSVEMDLSNAAENFPVYIAPAPCQIIGYTVYWTEAAGDANTCSIRVGKTADDDFYDIYTTAGNEALGAVTTNYFGALLNTGLVVANDMITVGHTQKTGAGKVMITLWIVTLTDAS